jgi:hypothetical protein
MTLTLHHLTLGETDIAKTKVEEAQKMIGEVAEVDALVNSAYYYATSLLHRVKRGGGCERTKKKGGTFLDAHVEPTPPPCWQYLGNTAEFYTNSLLYLAYTPLSALSLEQQQQLAFDLGVAALCAEKIYQFGELVWPERGGRTLQRWAGARERRTR